ncbi:MAG: sporulation integral membrane protein YtvI [Clostridia bacterium]|nr:sporulation integral membrane protein YtvI [Clostridia bacterium]
MDQKQAQVTMRKSLTNTAATLFCILAAAAAGYIIFKYLFALTLPFLLGAGLGALASALANKLSKFTGASRKTVSFAVLIFLLASFVTLLFFGVRRLLGELGKLAEGISSGEGTAGEFFRNALDILERFGEKLASLLPDAGSDNIAEKTEAINAFIEKIVGDTLSSMGSAIPGLLSGILKALPELLLGLIVTVIAAFYFTLDSERIRTGIRSVLPESAKRMLSHIKKEAAVAAIGYLRSYSLILLITFAEIFFGLSVLGVEYSLIIAAITAIVDILPVLGVGIVLLPWALFALVTKDIFLGVGLLLLYVVTVIVRQFIEPRIVGENLGLHPLLTLAAFYIGYRLFGFAGILLAPLSIVAWRAIRTYSKNAAISGS